MSTYITPRKAIIAVLRNGPRSVDNLVPGVATRTRRAHSTINRTLRDMRVKNEVVFNDGRYSLPSAPTPPPPSGGLRGAEAMPPSGEEWEGEEGQEEEGEIVWDDTTLGRLLRDLKRGVPIGEDEMQGVLILIQRRYLWVTKRGQEWLENEV